MAQGGAVPWDAPRAAGPGPAPRLSSTWKRPHQSHGARLSCAGASFICCFSPRFQTSVKKEFTVIAFLPPSYFQPEGLLLGLCPGTRQALSLLEWAILSD